MDLRRPHDAHIDFALDKGYTISGYVTDASNGQALPAPGM